MAKINITKGTTVTVMYPKDKQLIRDMWLYIYPPNALFFTETSHNVNVRPKADIRATMKGVPTQKFDVETLDENDEMLVSIGGGWSRNAMLQVKNIGKVNSQDARESLQFKLVSIGNDSLTELTAFTNAIRQVHYDLKS